MAISCSYIPRNKRGEELKGFKTYKKELGHSTAAKVFTQVISPSFKNDYADKIELDSQGVPTYESASKIPYIKKLIGTSKLIDTDQKNFPYVENNRENYNRLILSAYSYNKNSDNKELLVAVVTESEYGDIRVEIREKNKKNEDEFLNQYSTNILNQKIISILNNTGIDITMLENNEITNGFIDFSKASNIADGFIGLINIANGMQGELALSEEFSHLIIGMYRDTPMIQRSINILKNNQELVKEILGDEYETNKNYYEENSNYDALGNIVSTEETLAEEALGRVLQEKLKTNIDYKSNNEQSKPLNNLVNRLINFIKSIFKGNDSNALYNAKIEANASMDELAKKVLHEEKIDTTALERNKRKAVFNNLKEETDKILKILNNANEIERKRSKIDKDNAKEIKKRITTLEAYITSTDKITGLFEYSKWAIQDLQNAYDSMVINEEFSNISFQQLRNFKSILDSYSGFINEFQDLILETNEEELIITVGGEEINLKEYWRNLHEVYNRAEKTFKEQALSAFSEYLAPIYEKSPLKNADGSIKDIKDVILGEDFDISEFDRWLVSMGNSSSLLLQLFDKAVKKAKEEVKRNTMDSVREVWKIRDNAEKRGITSYEWMFELDNEGNKTGNYISPYNQGQFEKDKKEMEEGLIKKYGKKPIGEEYKKAMAEKKTWYSEHSTVDSFGHVYPNSKYRNPQYSRLSQAQLDTLNEILEYKKKVESALPKNKRNVYRAVQRRRSGVERTLDTIKHPGQAYESLKEDLKSVFASSEDDDIMYGETTRGLQDFTGKEYLTLPILYTRRLNNPNTLSTDVISDLMAYSYMANTYTAMNQTYDPIEIGMTVVKNKSFVKEEGGKVKQQVLNVMGKVSKQNIKLGDNTNFEKKLRDYVECQIYGRYLKEDDVFGKNTQKAVSFAQKFTSMAYLGCNWLAGVANVVTAVGMQNIEAAAGEFFGAKTLAKADVEYGKLIGGVISELASRSKENKLSLFDELFDVKQDIKNKVHNTQYKSILKRFFGENWMFIQQGLGDHWIYNRTAIAMAMKQKVKINGEIKSVWDALEIKTNSDGYKYMTISNDAVEVTIDKNGNAVEGNKFDVGDFSRRIAHINHTIAGIYNDEDQNAANRVIIGRLAMQMRKWIIPQMMRRFQSKRMIMDIGREEEGYYRTFGTLAKDLWKSGFKFTSEWNKLSDSEKSNVKRALTEITQTYVLWVLATALGGTVKDPDRCWAMKFAEYMINREAHELGFLTPGPMMLTEGYKTITSPIVAASAANKVAQALQATINPQNWFVDDDDLIKSGRYEGHSNLYKRWAELPIPPFTQIRQIDKFFDELETGTKYYSQDYR